MSFLKTGSQTSYKYHFIYNILSTSICFSVSSLEDWWPWPVFLQCWSYLCAKASKETSRTFEW